MAITDPRVIAYTNEVVRPIAESIRNLKARIDTALITWDNEIETLVPNDANEILEDGRAGDGVSILSGQNINQMKAVLAGLQTQLDQPNVADIVSRPCVRPLEVQ